MVQCVLNSSSADVLKDKSRALGAQTAIQAASCQMGKRTRSRKSIASFQLRKGNLLGCAVNLRGAALHSFLDQYIFLVSPRAGTKSGKVQQRADYSLGKSSFLFFPGLDMHFLALSSAGGFNCTFSFSSRKRKGVMCLLAALQFPGDSFH